MRNPPFSSGDLGEAILEELRRRGITRENQKGHISIFDIFALGFLSFRRLTLPQNPKEKGVHSSSWLFGGSVLI